MPTLEDTIAALFKRATSEPSAEGTAPRGLHLKARITQGQRQLLLSRPDVKPSDVEVSTCARHGGFASYEVTGGPRWQLIAELGAVRAGAGGVPDSALTGQVCGTCANGTPTEYPNEVECQLGWERHDGALRPMLDGKFEWVPIPQGHGALTLPILHPAQSCVAVLGGSRPGWASA
jgi:hypothetical protein